MKKDLFIGPNAGKPYGEGSMKIYTYMLRISGDRKVIQQLIFNSGPIRENQFLEYLSAARKAMEVDRVQVEEFSLLHAVDESEYSET